MARYTGSKTKLSRRVSRNLFLKGARSFSPKDDYSRRPFINAKRGRRPRSLSEYGKQLKEKQALKFSYGLLEKQMSNVFKKSFKRKGDTGANALTMLEMRLDNVIYKSGLANSRYQARQLVNHSHFLVNNKKASIPSFLLKPGDVIKVKESKLKKSFWQNFSLEVPGDVPTWLEKKNNYEIKVLNNPIKDDLPIEFNIASIVEYYSNKVA